MNMNHIINMIIRQVMNRVIRKGIDTSMNAGSNMMPPPQAVRISFQSNYTVSKPALQAIWYTM